MNPANRILSILNRRVFFKSPLPLRVFPWLQHLTATRLVILLAVLPCTHHCPQFAPQKPTRIVLFFLLIFFIVVKST